MGEFLAGLKPEIKFASPTTVITLLRASPTMANRNEDRGSP